MELQEGSHEFSLPVPKFLQKRAGGGAGAGDAVAPMPGVIEKVSCKEGDKVEAGDPLVVMIAMKMEVSQILWWFVNHTFSSGYQCHDTGS